MRTGVQKIVFLFAAFMIGLVGTTVATAAYHGGGAWHGAGYRGGGWHGGYAGYRSGYRGGFYGGNYSYHRHFYPPYRAYGGYYGWPRYHRYNYFNSYPSYRSYYGYRYPRYYYHSSFAWPYASYYYGVGYNSCFNYQPYYYTTSYYPAIYPTYGNLGYCSNLNSYSSPALLNVQSAPVVSRILSLVNTIPNVSPTSRVDPFGIKPVSATLLNIDSGRGGIVDKILTVESRATAAKDSSSVSNSHLELGDKLFAQRRYREAFEQYKRATAFASDSAHVYFRQGFALVATKRFDQAVTAFRNGMAADPSYIHSGFRLDDLYAINPGDKTEHFDALAAAAIARPNDAPLLFSLGVLLHFDGQLDRAEKFFARASSLSPVEERYARSFLRARPLAVTAGRDGFGERDL